MPKTIKVELAERPTRIMAALYAGSATWGYLREVVGAVSTDMNLLHDLGFVESQKFGEITSWSLSENGRNACREEQS